MSPRTFALPPVLAAASSIALVAAVTLFTAGHASAAESPVALGVLSSYSVIGGSAVTNTGSSVVGGGIGVSPGTDHSGMDQAVIGGAMHFTDTEASQAQLALVGAYDDAAGRIRTPVASELGGQTFLSGVYGGPTLGITGTVTLDAQQNPDAVWIFQTDSTLITATASSVSLINGAQACHVFWQVQSSATLGTGSTFVGNVLALTSITATTQATIQGRLLARNGAVTLDTNTITGAECNGDTPPTSSGSESSSSSSTSTGSGSSSSSSSSSTSTESGSSSSSSSQGSTSSQTSSTNGSPTTPTASEAEGSSNSTALSTTPLTGPVITSPATTSQVTQSSVTSKHPSTTGKTGVITQTGQHGIDTGTKQLAITGTNSGPIAGAAAALIACGTVLLLSGRRRLSPPPRHRS
ncbi:DUF3494 domain-containing protein [Nakamurella antarctica]|uniref:DUF3494 domain-containing protein n=1 Tax=Nakamurella antarctica TaxID=1902245 RepID=A0A3G8ZM84_9ACTN|nr:ice-binding family protein [Nakamurella antarctica]AZI58340.1 DUF3494 domain-containing protein [Nakamurella antarctica]